MEGDWGWAAVHSLFLTPPPSQSGSGSQTQVGREPQEQSNRGKMQLQTLGSSFLKSPPPSNPNFSRTPFASPADDEEEPSVTLHEWWLAKVEGHEREISVAGFYMKKQEILEFSAGLIAMRHGPCRLETEDGIIVFTLGYFNVERTLENGFTIEACERFSLGFPFWWKYWNMYYPNIMISQTVSQPRSSRTSSSCDDSNVSSACMVDLTNDMGRDNDSHENKGCQKTIATHVKSSEKGKEPAGTSRKKTNTKSSTSNHDSNKVGNIERDLIGARTLKEKSHNVSNWNAPSACIRESSNGLQKTHVASLKKRRCLKNHQHGKQPAVISRKQTIKKSAASNHGSNKVANIESDLIGTSTSKENSHDGIGRDAPSESTGVCINDKGHVEKDNSSHLNNGYQKTDLPSRKRRGCLKKPKPSSEDSQNLSYSDVQSSMQGNPRLTRLQAKLSLVSLPENQNLQRTRSGQIVVPTQDVGWQIVVYSHGKQTASTSRKQTIRKSAGSNHDSNRVANIETNGHQKNHVPSRKRRGCQKKPKLSSEDSQNLSYSDVHSSMQGNPHLTRRQAKLSSVSLPECLNLQQTRSGQVVPTQDAGCQIVVYDHSKVPAGSSKKQTIKKCSGSNNDSNKVANIETDGHLKNHVPSRKRQHCLKKPKNESEDVQSSWKVMKLADTSRKQTPRQCLYGNTRTRHQAKLLSVSLPESLNLPRTRSGRIVVPTLDAGCQNIVYNNDGSISAIKGYRSSKVCFK